MIPFIVVIGIYAVMSIIFTIVAFVEASKMSLQFLFFALTLISVYFFIVMLAYRAKVTNDNQQNPINIETLATSAV